MNEQDFKNICELARIKYEEHMFEGFKSAFSVIKKVETFDEDVEIKYNINDPEVMPESDEPKEGLTNDEALLNAHKKKYGYFVINKYVGE